MKYSSILQVIENRCWIDRWIRIFIVKNEELFLIDLSNFERWEDTWKKFQYHVYCIIHESNLGFVIYEHHKGILKMKIFNRDFIGSPVIGNPKNEVHFEYNIIKVIREEKIKSILV